MLPNTTHEGEASADVQHLLLGHPCGEGGVSFIFTAEKTEVHKVFNTKTHKTRDKASYMCFKLRFSLLQHISCKVLCFACNLEVLLLFSIHMHFKVFISIYFICTCKHLKIFVDVSLIQI